MKKYNKRKGDLSFLIFWINGLYSWSLLQSFSINMLERAEDISDFNEDFNNIFYEESDA